ncbi:PREDICTED: endonuclease domain-containing 1 protein-like [Acanthisitta chloris]|uniref:endonuclease domain-containing 1 protein-like n=1 Tax=Acanthisitta chloris TaxID=57068 RepID=UPI0004F0CD26|nr:PREDICTED: endonuclease domain-containing 1 protein-like [Acanthisitta chloris]
MLWLLLLQVSSLPVWLGHSEVVRSLETSCPQFFYRGMAPNEALEPPNPAQICQRYKNQYYFATLYDRNMRIPVYSAYIYDPGHGKRPRTWLVKLHLMGPTYPKTMEKEWTLLNHYKVSFEQLSESQAILQDYKNLTGLNRGHLNPNGHHHDYSSRIATFTLTNIVPQHDKLNGGAWNNYEQQTMIRNTKGCNTTYVVVGAVPGNNYIAGGRVNKPGYLWASACCEVDSYHRKAWGVIAENDKNQVELLTLGELEDTLTQLYGRGQVSLFHSDCPRE